MGQDGTFGHLIKILWREEGCNALQNICSRGLAQSEHVNSLVAQPFSNFRLPITDKACWRDDYNSLGHWCSIEALLQESPH